MGVTVGSRFRAAMRSADQYSGVFTTNSPPDGVQVSSSVGSSILTSVLGLTSYEETLKNYLGLEVVMGTTKFLDIAIANDSGTGQMLSTNLCPLLKICGPTSAVKFLNDQFDNIHFISSVDFGGSNVNLISPNDVINKVNEILQSS